MKPGAIVTLFLLFFFSTLYSQSENWANYFSGNEIYCLTESPNFIWVGTECRIVRVNKQDSSLLFLKHINQDKEACISYRLKEIVADSNDNLWLGHDNGGLFFYNGEEWLNYDTLTGAYLALDLNNHLWFRSPNHELCEFDGNNLNTYPLPESLLYSINQISIDSNAETWMATEKGLVHFDGTNYIEYTAQNSELPANNLTTIDVDSDNNIWVAGDYYNDSIYYGDSVFLAKFNGEDWNILTQSNGNLPQYGWVRNIHIDNEQNIWLVTIPRLLKYDGIEWTSPYIAFGDYYTHFPVDFIVSDNSSYYLATQGKGLLSYSNTTSTWNQIPTANSGLLGNRVKALEFDENNILWVGTSQYSPNFTFNQKGFASFNNDEWVSYDNPSSDIPYDASSFTIDNNNNLWAANPDALYKLKPSGWNKYTKNLYSVRHIAADNNNNIWIPSGEQEIYKFNGGFSQYTIPGISPYYPPKSAGFGSDGSKWFGTFYKLVRQQGNTWSYFDYTNSGLTASANIYELKFEANGSLWIGGGCLVSFDGTYWTHHKTDGNGTGFDLIYCIEICDNGDIWFGTYDNGLIKFDQNIWIRYLTSNSTLLGNNIYDITFDTDNNIWVGTDCGISMFDGSGGDTITVSSIITGTIESKVNSENNISIVPNPFHSKSIVSIDINSQENLSCKIFSMTGELIHHFDRSDLSSGQYHFIIDDNILKIPGIFIVEVKQGNDVKNLKIIKY